MTTIRTHDLRVQALGDDGFGIEDVHALDIGRSGADIVINGAVVIRDGREVDLDGVDIIAWVLPGDIDGLAEVEGT